jgi:alkylhydroperoxidase family enzyme
MAPPEAQVRLVERNEVPEAARAAYDHVAEARGGTMGNVFKALANSPGALEKVAAVGEFIRFRSKLDDALRELVILTVAANTKCAYEWTHHQLVAERLEIAPEVLRLAGTPAMEQQPDPIGSAVRYARMVANGEHADHDTMHKLRDALGDEGIVELTVAVGYYLLLSRFINTIHVPLENGVEARPFPGEG